MDDLTPEKAIDLAICFANPFAANAFRDDKQMGWSSSISQENGKTIITIDLAHPKPDNLALSIDSILKRFNDAAIISNYSGKMFGNMIEADEKPPLQLAENINITCSKTCKLEVQTNLSPQQIQQVLHFSPAPFLRTEFSEISGMLGCTYRSKAWAARSQPENTPC